MRNGILSMQKSKLQILLLHKQLSSLLYLVFLQTFHRSLRSERKRWRVHHVEKYFVTWLTLCNLNNMKTKVFILGSIDFVNYIWIQAVFYVHYSRVGWIYLIVSISICRSCTTFIRFKISYIPILRSFGLSNFLHPASKVYVINYSSKILKSEVVFYFSCFQSTKIVLSPKSY